MATTTAFCGHCGRAAATADLVTIAGVPVCAGCKPSFLRHLQEGAPTAAAALRYQGFWIRLVAKILDWIVVGVLLIPLWFVFMGSVIATAAAANRAGAPVASQFLGMQLLMNLASIVVTLAYSTWMNGRWGATVGKMAIGAVIVNTDGTAISYGKALARALAEILSGIILLIGYIMAAFDRQKRALHDQICGTLVVARR
ncbi:MAG: RDD family protein [Terriglobales bacterium]